MTTPVELQPSLQSEPRPAPWSDLALYLGVGIVLFLAASLGLGRILKPGTLLTSVLLYSVNVVVFGGTVLLVGVLRRRLSLANIGFWPPRISATWISFAVFLSLFFLPIRAGLALLVQALIGGGLEKLAQSPRMDIFAPNGFSWAAFFLTFLLAGVLVPIAEELFFRGALYTWFRSRMPVWAAVVVSSLIFGLGHADTTVVILTSFILGVINAVLFERSRTIWAPIVVHMVNNSLAVVLLYVALMTGNA